MKESALVEMADAALGSDGLEWGAGDLTSPRRASGAMSESLYNDEVEGQSGSPKADPKEQEESKSVPHVPPATPTGMTSKNGQPPSSTFKRLKQKVAVLSEFLSTRKLEQDFENMNPNQQFSKSDNIDQNGVRGYEDEQAEDTTLQRFVTIIGSTVYLVRVALSAVNKTYISFFDVAQKKVTRRSRFDASWLDDIPNEEKQTLLSNSDYFQKHVHELFSKENVLYDRPTRSPPPVPENEVAFYCETQIPSSNLSGDQKEPIKQEVLQDSGEPNLQLVRDLEAELKKARQDVLDLGERLHTANELGKQQQESMSALSTEKIETAELLLTMGEENKSLKSELLEKQKVLDALQVKHMDAVLHKEQLEKEMEKLTCEAEVIVEQTQEENTVEIQRLQATIRGMELKLEEEVLIRTETESAYEKTLAERLELDSLYQKEKEKVGSMETEIEDLNESYNAQKEYSAKLKNLIQELRSKAEEEYLQLHSKAENTSAQLEEMSKELLQLGVEKDEKTSQLEESTERLETLSTKLEQSNMELQSALKVTEQSTMELGEAKRRLQTLESERNDLHAECRDLRTRHAELAQKVTENQLILTEQASGLAEKEREIMALQASKERGVSELSKNLDEAQAIFDRQILAMSEKLEAQTRAHYAEMKKASQEASFSKVKLVDTMAELEQKNAEASELLELMQTRLDFEDEVIQKSCPDCKKMIGEMISTLEEN